MPVPPTSAPTTSGRLLALLSLLQSRRDWPGPLLSARLQVSPRTLRRDVDRLRELGYPIRAAKGPDGGYRLDAGTQLPLVFDDEQAVALAVALRTAVTSGAGIEEAAARALTTLRQVMPVRLRQRIDSIDVTAVAPPGRADGSPVDTAVLLAIGAAVRAREELRFDYASPTAGADGGLVPPRQVQPHSLVARGGRWYLVGWEPRREDWRVYRADRLVLRTPNGPRFVPRELPGGDVGSFLAARFRGSSGSGWPCVGEVVLDRPAAEVAPFAGDGLVEVAGPDRCRVRLGSWSWAGLAAALARFDAEIEVLGPPELRRALADLAARAGRAAASGPQAE